VELYTYIIVDDEMIIRQGCIAKLRQIPSLPVEFVGEASNGLEALALIEKMHPDIVITDMKMSGMDGMEFLERLDEQYPNILVIVISGYKLFDYVKQAIEKHAVGYVLKPFSAEEIGEQMRKAIEQLESRSHVQHLQQEVANFAQKEFFLNTILHPWWEGTSASFHENDQMWNQEYLLLTVTTERMDFTEKLESLCSGQLPFPCFVMENPLNKQQNLILLHGAKGQADLSGVAEQLAMQIGAMTQEKRLTICISRVVQKPAQLHSIYQENESLLGRVYLTDHIRVLHFDENKSVQPLISEENIQRWFLEMRYHTNKIPELLQKFFASFDVKRHSLGEIAATCESLLEKVNECASRSQIEVSSLTGNFCRKYLFCRNLDRILSDLTDYIHSVLNAVHMKETDQETLIQQLKEYIEKNYRKKLTLQMIASRFYISPACCSNLLKENLNMTFNDYLSDIRINKAKKLLTETNLSVNKISDEVGYSNPKYFFKIFKVYSGFTPLEYRTQKNMNFSNIPNTDNFDSEKAGEQT